VPLAHISCVGGLQAQQDRDRDYQEFSHWSQLNDEICFEKRDIAHKTFGRM
jgi:hypothetical protein